MGGAPGDRLRWDLLLGYNFIVPDARECGICQPPPPPGPPKVTAGGVTGGVEGGWRGFSNGLER